jgi:hypothetical protein
VVAKVRERLVMSKETMNGFLVEKFSLKTLNKMQSKE